MKSKRVSSLIFALVMVFSLTVSASAADPADTSEQVTAYLNYNLAVQFDGEAKLLGSVNGTQVYPITYGGRYARPSGRLDTEHADRNAGLAGARP